MVWLELAFWGLWAHQNPLFWASNQHTVGLPWRNIHCTQDKQHIAKEFDELWFSRYPWPEVCANDKGGEFIGPKFQSLHYKAGIIISAPSTSRSPQSNTIIERLHLTMGNSLRAQLEDNITLLTLEEAKSMRTLLWPMLYMLDVGDLRLGDTCCWC